MAYKKFSDFTIFNPPDVNDYVVGYRELGGEFRTTIKNLTDFVSRVSLPSDPTNLYVSISGDDSNFGNSFVSPFRTIKRAMAKALEVSRILPNANVQFEIENGWGTAPIPVNVFIQNGDYIEDNPIYVPAGVNIIGESIKSVAIIPKNKFYDILWVNNATSVQNINFKNYYSPSYSIAFPEFFYLNDNIVRGYPSTRTLESTAKAFTYFNQNSSIYTSTKETNTYPPNLSDDFGTPIYDPFRIAFLGRYYKDIRDNFSFYTEIEILQNKDFWQTSFYNLPTTIQKPIIIDAPHIFNVSCNSNFLSGGSVEAGSGVLIDGSRTNGDIPWMVIDNFVVSNDGGKAIHVTENAYAQISNNSSKFCSESIFVEKGASCSVNGSTSYYGSSGLVAVGKSNTPTLIGTLNSEISGKIDTLTVTNLGSTSLTSRQFYSDSYQPYVGQIFSIVDTNYLKISTGINYLTASNSETFFVIKNVSKVRPATPPYSGWECDIVLEKPYVFIEDSSVFDSVYSSTPNKLNIGSDVVFYNRSVILASSHIFEHIGAGTDSSNSTPLKGGVGEEKNETIHDSIATIIHNSQNNYGNLYIGDNVTVNQSSGTIECKNIITNTLSALSASISIIDLKYYELSGFDVRGDVNISGVLSATDLVYAFQGNSNMWNSVYTSTKDTSASWDSVYSSVNNVSSNWDSVYTSVNDTSANWDSVYTSVNNVSSNWDSVYTSTKDTSANWDSVYSSVNNVSSNWDSVYTSVNDTSANWDSVYTSVNDTSANWDSVYTSVNDTSANWDSVYTSVNNVSSNWDSVYSSVNNVSTNWDSVYTFTKDTSANWDSVYTSVNDTSASWDSVYSSVNNVSSNWDSVYTSVNDTSASWDNAYDTGTVYQQNSATYATIVFANSKFLPLSGGEVNGDLSVQGTLTVSGSAAIINATQLVISDNLIYLAEGNIADTVDIGFTGAYNHISENHEHVGLVRNHIDKKWTLFSSLTSEILSSLTIDFNDPSIVIDTLKANIEGNIVSNTNVFGQLSAQDLIYDKTGNSNNWNSVYTSVNNVSSNWDSVYSSVNNVSSNWDSVYTSVNDTSANWDSVYTSVNDTSANWDSVYTSVNDTSANWDSVYSSVNNVSSNWDSVYSLFNTNSSNYTTFDYVDVKFFPLSGGTITGDVEILSSLEVGSGDLILLVEQNNVSVYGTLSSNSIIYDLKGNSFNWNSVYSSVNSVSSNWNSVYSSVQSNSATTWNYQGTDLKNLSANWENAYTTVQSKSSTDWDNNLVTQYVINNYLPLSGGTLTGKLTLLNPSTTQSVLNIGVEASNPSILSVGDLWGTSAGLFYRSAPTITRSLAIQNGVNSFSRHQVIDALESVPALRVTQRGTGNALVVEDETTPDNTPFIVDNMGSVGIGLSSVEGIDAKLTVVGNVSAIGFYYGDGSQLTGILSDDVIVSTLVKTNSSEWNSTYSTVQSNSATTWNYQGTDLKNLSANWENAYTTVNSFSSSWEESDEIIPTVVDYLSTANVLISSLTVIDQLSVIGGMLIGESSGDSSVLYVGDDKVGINTEFPNEDLTVFGNISASGYFLGDGSQLSGLVSGDPEATTLVRNSSANWNSVYSTVQTNSAINWNYQGTDLKDLSANWENTYTTVQSNSSSWDSSGELTNYLPLSGGTLTGKLNIPSPSIEAGLNIGIGAAPTTPADGDIYIASNSLFFKIPVASPRQVALSNATNGFSQPQSIDTSATSAALRVTQRGTGNALVVEDETTPDNTPFIVNNMGSVGIGLSSVEGIDAKLTVVGNVSATGTIYTNNKQSVTTSTTNVAGTSAVTTILAVSAIPLSPDPNTLYILI